MSPPPSASRVVVASRSTYLRRRSFPLTLSSIKEHPDPADLDAEEEAAAYQLKVIPEPDCKRQSRSPREKLVESRETDNRCAPLPIFICATRLTFDSLVSRFGVSLVPCRTSCCRTLARVEQISDVSRPRLLASSAINIPSSSGCMTAASQWKVVAHPAKHTVSSKSSPAFAQGRTYCRISNHHRI